MKPDFEKMAFDLYEMVEQYPVDHSSRLVEMETALQDAYAAGVQHQREACASCGQSDGYRRGLECAAEIADYFERRNVPYGYTAAIRAEKEKTNG